MLENCILQGLAPKLLITMKVFYFFLVGDSVPRRLLKETLVRILLILKLLKVTATVLQFNITSFLDLTVQVGLNLASAPLRHISREQMSRQVPQRIKIAVAESLIDTILLLVRKFIEHGAKVWNLVVILNVTLS